MRLPSLEESQDLLREASSIAVLGIKPDHEGERSAHWIPSYLAYVGYEIHPVPVGYDDVTTILGRPVVRRLDDLAICPDIVSIFRRPEDIPVHLDQLLRLRPPTVWFQSVCMNEDVAQELRRNGIRVVCSCIGCTRATIAPSYAQLPGQKGQH